ncbi:MAG: HAD-IIA family hydrolase [Actinomycetota bacterium]
MGTIAERYDALFFDLDGVVYRGDQVIPNAPRALNGVRDLRVNVLFLTNNSSKTPEEVARNLGRLGVRAIPEEVLTSGLATASMLWQEGAEGRTAFVIGERGVKEALAAAGIRILDGEPERSDLVVVGWDRSVDYRKLRVASLLIERGAKLVATNADAAYPAPDGLWPGAGAILAAVTTTTEAVPTVVGKPGRPLFEAAARLTGAKNPLVIGDRLESDIVGARGMGWDSLLVFTGTARPPDLLRGFPLPTYLGADLSALLEDTPRGEFRRAAQRDVGALRALLGAAALTAEGVEGRLPFTLVSEDSGGGEIVSTACVEQVSGVGLLRSVAVREPHRGRGLGMLAVAAAISDARARGLAHVSLFTETAAAFFERMGFRPVQRSDLPEPVRASPQAAMECSASAIGMAMDLDRPRP